MKPNGKKSESRRLRLLGLKTEQQDVRDSRSCVLIQIDGLSHENFNRAIVKGKLPFLRRYLRAGHGIKGSWQSMLPTSTGAFQTGLFYGNNDDVPGFFWYDKRTDSAVSLNTVRCSADLEDRVKRTVAPYPGLLSGGSAYCALFCGGATNTILTFAKLFHPSVNIATTWLSLALFAVFQFVLIARIMFYALMELMVAIYDLVCALFTEKNKYLEFRFVVARIATVVLCREIATLAAILDIYRGTGPIYLNHIAYDEHAHHRGPTSAYAFWTLRGIDASIERVWRTIEHAKQLGIRDYDFYVWSDHGQTDTLPFQEVFNQDPDRHFDSLFQSMYAETEELRAHAHSRHKTERIRRGRFLRGQHGRYARSRIQWQAEHAENISGVFPGVLKSIYRWFLKPARNQRTSQNGADKDRLVHLISTGPVAHLYLLDRKERLFLEDWLECCPEFVNALADHPGIGFALARSKPNNAKVGVAGLWYDISNHASFRNVAPDIADVIHENLAEFKRWAAMPSAGDVILFGYRGKHVPSISYSYERGGHTGPSSSEMTPFIIVPQHCAEMWKELTDDKARRLRLHDLQERLRNAYTNEKIISEGTRHVS
ncbi:MAG: hypothetical protein SGI88_11730 [Candidatus Hydrogenedentes bacterium]|nr:hypothetical protein [Candidatus Hydrogenedentota bacterium]